MRSVDYNNRDLYAFEVKDINVAFVKDETVTYVEGDIDIVSYYFEIYLTRIIIEILVF